MKPFSLKSTLGSSLLTCAIAIGAFAPGSRSIAQSSSFHLVADIPFDFRSGSELMPAGKYDIQVLSDHVLILRASDQPRAQMLSANSAETLKQPDHSKLVFHVYGNRHFLYQVWSQNRASGFQLPKSHAEKEMLRAENNPVPSTSELALNQIPLR